jgi:hypothetical protein
MAEPCFVKKGSDPPVCGVHDVQLTKRLIPIELITPEQKQITYLVCPVARTVLNDEEKPS